MLIEIGKDISEEEALKIANKELDENSRDKEETVEKLKKKIQEKSNG
jgi:hypothetical protein